jgi:hypothetical protein
MYPIVEYAHKIGKSTADFTVKDLAGYMKWWLKEPPRKDLMEGTEAQRKTYEADVVAMKKWRKEEEMKKYTTKKYEDAQTSRLAEHGIESPINDGKEEIVIHPESEVVCSMELTKIDVEALKFAIHRILEDYEMNHHAYGESLRELLVGLEGV